MNDKLFSKKLDELIDLFGNAIQYSNIGIGIKNSLGDSYDKFINLWKEIFDELIWNTDQLTYIKNPDKAVRAKRIFSDSGGGALNDKT